MSNKWTLKREKSESSIQNAKMNNLSLYLEDDLKEDERFDRQELLVGSDAKQKFWELYKSERKFKDFKPG